MNEISEMEQPKQQRNQKKISLILFFLSYYHAETKKKKKNKLPPSQLVLSARPKSIKTNILLKRGVRKITCSLNIKRCFIRNSCPSIGVDVFAISLLAFHVQLKDERGRKVNS
ncbi:hypothetical protein V6Z11_A04G004200 [Gossypium hirsutum]